MIERRWWIAALTLLTGCATQRTTEPRAVAPPRRAVTQSSRSVANEARFPARGCTPSAPVVQGFTAQTAPLDALAAAAELPADEPVSAFEHGVVRANVPSGWWPARVDARDFTAYRMLTGDEASVVSVYIGDRPSFRAPGGHEFRLLNGGTLLRGTLSRQDRLWRLEALALLPCASPRHVHVSAQSEDPRVIARVARTLRSLRVVREESPIAQPIVLDSERDRPRIEALTASEPAMRAWLLAALAAGDLRAKYPLTVDHPLADQELTARARASFQGVGAELWLSLAMRAGALNPAHVFIEAAHAQAGDALSRALSADGCARPSLTIAQDGVALRCEGEPELRGAYDERDAAQTLSAALDRVLAMRAMMRRWRAQPAAAWGYPASLCSDSASAAQPVVVSSAGSVSSARWGRCLLAARAGDRRVETLSALAIEGVCAQVPDAPWSRALRTAGRFAELSAQAGQGECRYTVALRDGHGWVVSANDGESAMGPVGQGLAMGVDRAAIARAVGVMIDLASMSAGRRDEAPQGVAGTVLTELALDRPGTLRARDALRWWYALGGVEGALPVAVMDASTLAADRVRVVFAAWTLEVSRGASGWIVSSVQRTRW